MERPPPLPPRGRLLQQYSATPVLSQIGTGDDRLDSFRDADTVVIPSPPSLPPRRAVRSQVTHTHEDSSSPPLPPRMYDTPTVSSDLICWNTTPSFTPEQLTRLYQSSIPPPLPPRVPVNPLNASIPPANLSNTDVPLSSTKLPQHLPAGDLIDLNQVSVGSPGSTRSLLEDFDPLTEIHTHVPDIAGIPPSDLPIELDQPQHSGSTQVHDSQSCYYYNSSDPFNYMYGASKVSSDHNMYVCRLSAHGESDVPSTVSAPPLPPRQRPLGPITPEDRSADPLCTASRLSDHKNRQLSRHDTLEEHFQSAVGCIRICRHSHLSNDADITSFRDMVVALRGCYKANDCRTNPGIITSSVIETSVPKDVSIKVRVYDQSASQSTSFVCDVTSSVEHVVSQSLITLDLSPSVDSLGVATAASADARDYAVRVRGTSEYLVLSHCLYKYAYVQRCVLYDQCCQLVVMPANALKRPLARTMQDDLLDVDIKAQDLVTASSDDPVMYSQLTILLECVERECTQVRGCALDTSGSAVRSERVEQSVKAVCSLLGSLQTMDLVDALDSLSTYCHQLRHEKVYVSDELHVKVRHSLGRIVDSLRYLLKMYSKTSRTDFTLIEDADISVDRPLGEVLDCMLVRVVALQRLPPDLQSHRYVVSAQLFHGSNAISQAVVTRSSGLSHNLFAWVVFDEWLEMSDVAICYLPREARLVLSVHCLQLEQDSDMWDSCNMAHRELGWTSLQLFSFSGRLAEGGFLLPLWESDEIKEIGPAPLSETHPSANDCVMLHVEFPSLGNHVQFPVVDNSSIVVVERDFSLLDEHTQRSLITTIDTDIFSPVATECRELLWDRRYYLMHEPKALTRVLLSAHSWEHAYLAELHAMVAHWSPLQPLDAIQLLLPSFADGFVRAQAVKWIQVLSNDELVNYLPQLVEAVKYETWDTSPLARFLLQRCLESVHVAQSLHWLLRLSLSACLSGDDVSGARYKRRLTVLQRALGFICGQNVQRLLCSQDVLVRSLFSAAEMVKTGREHGRQQRLMSAMESVNLSLQHTATALPLFAGVLVNGVSMADCSFFSSNSLPFLVTFTSAQDGDFKVPVIYKVGDDLRQDVLTLQMIRLMKMLWMRAGIDLCMVTFNCVATGNCSGMIEVIEGAETLCSIQKEQGLTGAFKDMSIFNWLTRHNPSAFSFERAVQNFTASCAGYCVATYVLGICDRHNDNIMLKTSGHLFHIDFGKFLGDAQRFGAFKRDRTPFVLTTDMVYVINGGEKPSPRFQHFVDLCCSGFNVIRRNRNAFMNLFALMASSGIPGVSREAVDYIKRALLPGLTEQEATVKFARFIQQSLSSWFTPVNFFLHSLAQFRFSDEQTQSQLLTFVPKCYSEIDDGRILSLSAHGYQKRYEPEKFYVYIIRLMRESVSVPSYVFRTYKEFLEFGQKLEMMFPLIDFISLPKGGIIGRSHIKQVAESRLRVIDAFLRDLWQLADEVRHNRIVYTFLHPMLRDQQEPDIHRKKLKDLNNKGGRADSSVHGQLQLSFSYRKNTFCVCIQHAKDLATQDNVEPNAYVKLYLVPDPNKFTKRKTKVVRKNSHPTFMEMIVYRMPLVAFENRVLQASVWHQDHLQENTFLGVVLIRLDDYDLRSENKHWFILTNDNRLG